MLRLERMKKEAHERRRARVVVVEAGGQMDQMSFRPLSMLFVAVSHFPENGSFSSVGSYEWVGVARAIWTSTEGRSLVQIHPILARVLDLDVGDSLLVGGKELGYLPTGEARLAMVSLAVWLQKALDTRNSAPRTVRLPDRPGWSVHADMYEAVFDAWAADEGD